jgi:hypothetical protein
MDPFSPIPEVRKHVIVEQVDVDEYGDTWKDGVKVAFRDPSQVLRQHDAARVAIRAALDGTGIREKTRIETIPLEDGTTAEVELLQPGDANVLQFGAGPKYARIEMTDEGLAKLPDTNKKNRRSRGWSQLKKLFRKVFS